MSQSSCPQCGAPLASGTLEGLCPACLLQKGFETKEGSEPTVRFEAPSLERLRKLFPQLEIMELIGRGGMAAVYKARQPALDRMVALKILGSAAETGNFEQRFNREARALAKLNHPNIIGVYEFGEIEGLHFFLMEYVDGVNLRQLQKAGRIAPRDALQIVPQICDALQYAHDEGVVHRDIKPENVLIDRKGRVKVADFGLAKILGLDADVLRLTGEGHVMGTPHYMAPEQLEHPLDVDHRADIYSLGVVFYELLTGELPLGRFAPPSRKVTLDVRLDEVVLRTLEKEPQHRYERASEIKTQVETISSHPDETGAPIEPQVAPRLSRNALVGCVWAFCSILAGVAYFPVHSSSTAPVEGMTFLRALAVVLGLVGISSPLGSVLSGVIGLQQIRWSEGRLYGRRLALFDALLFPLLVLDFVIVMASKGVAGAIFPPGQVAAVTIDRAQMAATTVGVLLCIAVDLAIVTWLWQRISRPRPEHETSAPPSKTSPLAAAALFLVCAIGSIVLIGIIAVIVAIGVPAYQRSQNTAPATLSRSGERVNRATLDTGTIKLLAVTAHPSNEKKGWLADGAPAADGPFANEGSQVFPGNDRKTRELVFSVEGLPEDASLTFKLDPGYGWAGGQIMDRGGDGRSRYALIAAAFPKDAATSNVSVGVAMGAWETVAEQSPDSDGMQSSSRNGRDVTVSFLKPVVQASGGIVVHVTHNGSPDEVRIVAVDKVGREHTGNGQSGTGGGAFSQIVLTFTDVPLDQIRAIRFQARAYRWKEFPHVRLSPTETSTPL